MDLFEKGAVRHPSGQDRPLRPYQVEAINATFAAMRAGKRRIILGLPTGAGKTRLAGKIFEMGLAKGRRCLFVVPAISLIDQTVESFGWDGMTEIGVIQADHDLTNPSQPIQVASVQTLIRRKKKPEVDLVIIDEAHRMYKSLMEWLATPEMASVPVIGLSATPWTRGMADHFDELIVCSTTKKMIEAGYLCDFRVFLPVEADMSDVKIVAGDYDEGQSSLAMSKPKIVADVVETWLKLGENLPTLCFAVDCAHAKHLQSKFEEANVPCGYIDAFTNPDEREVVRRKFHSGEYPVVVNIGTLTTGVDWDVRCIILARPTRSEMLFCQIIGRGLRTAPGKKYCLVIDHTPNHREFGAVTEIHHDTLNSGKKDDKKKKKREPLAKKCPKCFFLRPPKVLLCPNCGHQAEPPPPSVEVEVGELVEMRRSEKSAGPLGPANCIQIKGRWITHDDFFGQLMTAAEVSGYNPKWAAVTFKDAVGTWPSRTFLPPKVPVSYEVECWIRARLAQYRRDRAKDASTGRHA